MRVLVTGGAGYIGSHTCKALSRSGFQPVVLDNLSTGHRSFVKWGPLLEVDLADRQRLRQILIAERFDAVIHFAAHAYVGESHREPAKYMRNNVINTLNLLDAMLEAGTPRFVFSSTCATYGIPHAVPITELSDQRPINPYGDSKLFVEKVLKWYAEAYGIRWVALRYFNAAGADPEGEIGEDHNPETHLIPLVIRTAMGLQDHVDIYGTDYPTYDGSAVRDYVHVTDLADAHVRAVRYLLEEQPSIALNLGSGRGYSVRDVIDSVERVTGRNIQVHELPRRLGDPSSLVAEATKAKSVLGWEPTYHHLDDIVKTAYAWHKARQLNELSGE